MSDGLASRRRKNYEVRELLVLPVSETNNTTTSLTARGALSERPAITHFFDSASSLPKHPINIVMSKPMLRLLKYLSS